MTDVLKDEFRMRELHNDIRRADGAETALFNVKTVCYFVEELRAAKEKLKERTEQYIPSIAQLIADDPQIESAEDWAEE